MRVRATFIHNFIISRYSRPSIISQLPLWISKHLKTEEKFGPAIPQIRKFFKEKE